MIFEFTINSSNKNQFYDINKRLIVLAVLVFPAKFHYINEISLNLFRYFHKLEKYFIWMCSTMIYHQLMHQHILEFSFTIPSSSTHWSWNAEKTVHPWVQTRAIVLFNNEVFAHTYDLLSGFFAVEWFYVSIKQFYQVQKCQSTLPHDNWFAACWKIAGLHFKCPLKLAIFHV